MTSDNYNSWFGLTLHGKTTKMLSGDVRLHCYTFSIAMVLKHMSNKSQNNCKPLSILNNETIMAKRKHKGAFPSQLCVKNVNIDIC